MNLPKPTGLSNIGAVIIDLDGTLLHTAPDFQVAINRMRSEFGFAPLSIDIITDFVGKGTENLIRRVLSIDFEPDEVEQHFDKALTSYLRHYQAINGDHTTLYPNVREGLDVLRSKRFRLACVTNKPIALAAPLLEKTGLHRYFELIYGGDSLPKKKPDPYPLLKVCEEFDLPPAQVVAIGDSSNDARAARDAGCRILTVPYGYNHGRPVQEIDSDGIVSTLLEAAHLISA
jgi:phosphoglycolate phosphatase